MTDPTGKPNPAEQAADFGPYSFSIRATDADCHDRLHLASLFSFMQEAAYHNAEALQIGTSLLDRHGMCWILIRIAVRLERLPHWGEPITVDTWNRGIRKLVFLRDFEFFDRNGARFGCGTSEWLIASKDSHRPQRPGQFLPENLQPSGARAVFGEPADWPSSFPALAAGAPVLVKTADFSDIDRVRHVGNTRYVAWCIDTVHAMLPDRLEFPDFRVTGLDIHYVREIRLGTKICCYGQADPQANPGAFLVEARRADDNSPVFRARVLTGPPV